MLRNMEIKAIITGDIVRSEQIALDKRDLLIKVLRDKEGTDGGREVEA